MPIELLDIYNILVPMSATQNDLVPFIENLQYLPALVSALNFLTVSFLGVTLLKMFMPKVGRSKS